MLCALPWFGRFKASRASPFGFNSEIVKDCILYLLLHPHVRFNTLYVDFLMYIILSDYAECQTTRRSFPGEALPGLLQFLAKCFTFLSLASRHWIAASSGKISRSSWVGDGWNRWFDKHQFKSLSYISISSPISFTYLDNDWSGFLAEHSTFMYVWNSYVAHERICIGFYRKW